MNGAVDVLLVMESDIRYTRERLAKARKRADEAARRKGQRVSGADHYCDWIEHTLEQKVRSRAAMEELIMASRQSLSMLTTVSECASHKCEDCRDYARLRADRLRSALVSVQAVQP